MEIQLIDVYYAYIRYMRSQVRFGMIISGNRRWKKRSGGKEAILVDDAVRTFDQLLFKPGIDGAFEIKLRKKLLSNGMFECSEQPLQILRFDNLGHRWEVDCKGEVVNGKSETKKHFRRADVAMLSYDYDLRIDVATETPISLESLSTWMQQRKKRRYTFTAKNLSAPWKIDLTHIECTKNGAMNSNSSNSNISDSVSGSDSEKEIELEFELLPTAKFHWLKETNETKVKEMTKFMAEQLLSLVDYCIPFDSDTALESSVEAVVNADFVGPIHKLNASILPQTQSSSRQNGEANSIDFLGSMPVNLTRQSLATVLANDYFMTEKSDGVRYLLYVVSDGSGKPTAVLFDRAKNIFRFRGSCEVGSALGQGTVLDGELVFNLKFKTHAFLVFDVLLWQGLSQLQKPFLDRLNLIKDVILANYSKNIEKLLHRSSSAARPINLIRKTFVRKEEGIQTLLSKIHFDASGSHRIFFDSDRRNHRTDGIIFQPNGPYVPHRHFGLLKWKWADLRSVDLAVKISRMPMNGNLMDSDRRVSLSLVCAGPDNTEINCSQRGDASVGLGVFDSYRLMAEVEDYLLPGSPRAVVEVAYDAMAGMWTYLQHRPDKRQANYIDTVLGVFIEQAEAIGVDELEFMLNSATFPLDSIGSKAEGLAMDFQSQMNNHAKSLVEIQRSKIADMSKSRPGTF